MRGARHFGTLLALCVAWSGAEARAASMAIPVLARAPGQHGSFVRSDVWFSNPGTTDVRVKVSFVPTGFDQAVTGKEMVVPARTQLRYEDAVSSLFGLSQAVGVAFISFEGDLAIGSRTYDSAGEGTYGELIPAIAAADATPAGEVQTVLFAAKSATMRTNLGIVNFGTAPSRATVVFRSSTGGSLASRSFDLPAVGHIQLNDVFGALGAPTGTISRIEVTATSPTTAYSSVVDNGTNDPTVEIARSVALASREVVVPAVAHAAGAAGSTWRSDVRIWNREARVVSVRLRYLPVGKSAPAAIDLLLGAGELVELRDVLARFGETSGSGPLLLSSSGRILAASRLYDDTPRGTSGQAIPGILLADAAYPGARLQLAGIEADAGSRTNAGFSNVGDKPVRLAFTLRSDAGNVLGTGSATLAPGESTQWNGVFGTSEGSGALTVDTALTAPSSEFRPSIVAWASVVDNLSNDPSFVPPANVTPETGFSIRRFRVTPDTLCAGDEGVVAVWEVLGAASSVKLIAGAERGSGLSGRAGWTDAAGEAPRLVIVSSAGTVTARVPFSAEKAPSIAGFGLAEAQKRPYCTEERIAVLYETTAASLVYTEDAAGYRQVVPPDSGASGVPVRIGTEPLRLVASSACGEQSAVLDVETFTQGVRNVSVTASPDVLYYYRWAQARMSDGTLCCGVRGTPMESEIVISFGNPEGVPIASIETTTLYGSVLALSTQSSGGRTVLTGKYRAPIAWVTDVITVTVTDICGNVATGSTTVTVNLCFPPEAASGCACPTWCEAPGSACKQESYCIHLDPPPNQTCAYCYYPKPSNCSE